MRITVQLSQGIQSVIQQKSSTVVVDYAEPMTIRKVAEDIGISPILIAFAIEDGAKMNLDDVLYRDASIHLFTPMAGG